jgi:hypothetical protein
MKSTKSQAALEFLITYGWAILGVLVVIGALVYFGVFNITKQADAYCYMGDQLKCEDFVIRSDGRVAMQVRNNFGVPIDIANVTITSDYGSTTDKTNMVLQNIQVENKSVIQQTNIGLGSLFEINGEMSISNLNMPTSKTQKLKVTVYFARSGSTVYHPISGDIYAFVVPAGTCSDGIRNCHYGNGNANGCETGIDCGHVADPGGMICGVQCGP